MRTRLGLRPLLGLGMLALLASACPADPSGDDEASTSEDTSSDGTSEDGTSTATDTGTDTTDGSLCDEAALDMCIETATSEPCSLGCPESKLTCGDASCQAACEVAQHSDVVTCYETHCPDMPDEATLCEQGCWDTLAGCVSSGECDLHQCQWDAGFCLPECTGCTADVALDFAYAGSCELPLPELIHPVLFTYFAVEVGDQSFDDVLDEGMACEAGLAGIIEHPLQGDVLVLCPDACDAFMAAGEARVLVEGPC